MLDHLPRLAATATAASALVRGGLAAIGYLSPDYLSRHLGAPPEQNPQLGYVVRVWAARDIALAVATLAAPPAHIVRLLQLLIAVDVADIASAQLAGRSGRFSHSDIRSLTLTAVAAIVPQAVALAVIAHRGR